MKYIWEVEDIVPGVMTRNEKAKEMWLIGYWYPDDISPAGSTSPALISMRDGMINRFQSKEEIVEHLNKTEKAPVLDFCQAEVWINSGRPYRDRPTRPTDA